MTSLQTTSCLTLLLAAALLSQDANGFQSVLPIMGGPTRTMTTLTTPLTRQNYATTADSLLSSPSSSSPASLDAKREQFGQRMRDLIQKQDELRQRQWEQQQVEVAPTTPHRKSRAFGKRPAFLREVSTVPEFEQVVLGETERITVVRFYQPSCRSCKAATPLFDAIAKKHPNLNWVEVPVTRKNADLHEPLGLTTVPFGHIYVPQVGLVEELKLGRPKMAEFEEILDAYVQGQTELPQEVHPTTGIYTSPRTSRSGRTAVAL
mmetsp:Transcript_14098/g.30714  ORF Transcript_14098/g.30714 Transcript_14098/m.30714 type:complete len:263 (+) Transcript_14098:321-1109(+)|eukprot:CAMPEP_0168736132 /NCGR_PEP_ID=MMETSP0724-20121128/9705_1 /TAXON_ID=265536 /ORGANISM="Amphiprora sp., Strain CCMP467" /LENGTH=262 /DNA_ID=CAMNT_0008783325 /DNA_START=135 /DNA_END=923 /DNA_ORIENTATION=+